MYYGTVLFMIDRTDEYQLLDFVRAFKAWHFLSTGVMGMFIGASLYIKCINLPYATAEGAMAQYQHDIIAAVNTLNTTDSVTAVLATVHAPPKQLATYVTIPNLEHCHDAGPGGIQYYYIEIISFFLNVIIVWWAFSYMRKASKKGLQDSPVAIDAVKPNSSATKSPRTSPQTPWHTSEPNVWEAWRSMFWLLGLDFFFLAFLSTTFFVFALFAVDFELGALGDMPRWQYGGLLFWLRTFYGLCAAPFLIFLLPFEGYFFVNVSAGGGSDAAAHSSLRTMRNIVCSFRSLTSLPIPCLLHSHHCPYRACSARLCQAPSRRRTIDSAGFNPSNTAQEM
jgi:hypothetical protein